MRPSRFSILTATSGVVHLYWRCHNKEFLLKGSKDKALYFQSLIRGLKHRGTDSSVSLRAFCVMDNHVHQLMTYVNGAKKLSHFMRVANGIFGALYNKAHKRTGKVANERPKTPLIGDERSEMRTHFYIEANPIRAARTTLEKLRYDEWNSYRYFAHGEVDKITENITPPEWYIKLGDTPVKRQRAYRRLFLEYLRNGKEFAAQFLRRFIGTVDWVIERERALKDFMRKRRENSLLQVAQVPPLI